MFQIFQDCFICDDCNDKLETSYTFKLQCIDVYQRINPTYQEQPLHYEEEDELIDPYSGIEDSSEPQKESEQEIFMIGASGGEGNIVEEDESKEYIVTNEDELDDVKDQFDDDQSNQGFENIYLEFEPEEELETKPPKTACRMNRKSYTVEEKLNIIKFAEENNNRVAARNYNINESSVRCFRRQKEILLKMNPQKKTNRKANPHWPQLEEELKKYVLNHPAEHGSKAKLKEIKKEAIEIAAKHGIEKFNGSNSYIFKFMQRHQLPSASPRPRKIKTDTQKNS